MYVYREVEPKLFRVGFFHPENSDDFGFFELESDHPTKDEAAARVNYLNGGTSPERLAKAIMDATIHPEIDIGEAVQGFPK